ncbi:MAG: tetratricopeptide repeat protein [Armatimonadetes bacterium]|nr:tetratricopeptide repeat protein [Armatimonadota bacterium]
MTAQATVTTETPVYLRNKALLALRNLAEYHLCQGDLAQTEFYARQATSVGPRSAKDLCLLGTVLQRRGNDDEAEKLFRRAVAAAPDYWPAYLALGALREGRGDVALAQDTYEAGLAHVPDQPELLYCLGIVQAKQDQLLPATQHLTRAYQLAPELPALRYNLYLALSQLNQLTSDQRGQVWRDLTSTGDKADARQRRLLRQLTPPPAGAAPASGKELPGAPAP